jgi:hypothetical protein
MTYKHAVQYPWANSTWESQPVTLLSIASYNQKLRPQVLGLDLYPVVPRTRRSVIEEVGRNVIEYEMHEMQLDETFRGSARTQLLVQC